MPAQHTAQSTPPLHLPGPLRPPTSLAAQAWIRPHQNWRPFEPPHRVITSMLDEIALSLARSETRPVKVICDWWRPGTFVGAHAADYLARITVMVEPGALGCSLACWFQWKHPRWQFASVADGIEGDVAAEFLLPAAAGAVS